MRRSHKIAFIFSAIALIFLALPLTFGFLTQHYTFRFVQNENKTLGKVLGLNIDLTQYHRGWFRSSAVVQIEKLMSDGSTQVLKSVPITIEHGPYYYSRNGLRAGVGLVKTDNIALGDNVAYQIHFYDNVGFLGERGVFVFAANKASQVSNLHVDSLIINMNSKLDATQFDFALQGSGLRFQDPAHSASLTIKNFQSALRAIYLSDRHWQLTFSLGLDQNQFATLVPGMTTPAPLTVSIDQVNLARVHIDTQNMAGLLSELIQLEQQSQFQQPVKPMAWAALIQQTLTDMIGTDTSMRVTGFSVMTPMGQLSGGYHVTFPTLPKTHDYFDLATHNVGSLNIEIPHWTYTGTDNTQFGLSNFSYHVFSNTVFARRSEMKLGAFDIRSSQSTVKAPAFFLNGLSYDSAVTGDASNLTQSMTWKLARACNTTGCYSGVDGQLALSRLNYPAFRGIAAATQRLMQYNPIQQNTPLVSQWFSLGDAYVKLITPDTQLLFSNEMTTPEGELSLRAQLSWPNLKTTSNMTMSQMMEQSQYTVHLLFPSAYADALLQDAKASQAPAQQPIASTIVAPPQTAKPSFEVQAAGLLQYAIQSGYLKKMGDSYSMDLAGKGATVTVNGKVWQAP